VKISGRNGIHAMDIYRELPAYSTRNVRYSLYDLRRAELIKMVGEQNGRDKPIYKLKKYK
jgi:hypothetical protein